MIAVATSQQKASTAGQPARKKNHGQKPRQSFSPSSPPSPSSASGAASIAALKKLDVVLTIGGGIFLAVFGSSKSEQAACACFVLAVVGLLFALFGAGFLAALALFIGAVVGCVGTGILIND